MPTIFRNTPGSTPPRANYHTMVPALCQLVRNSSSSLADFSDLLYPAEIHGDSALLMINSARASAKDPEAIQLFDELRSTHNNCAPSDWFKILGHIVEESSRQLIAHKYGTGKGPYWRHPPEATIIVNDTSGSTICGTGDFPMDAIAWDIALDYGEALEVKKSVEGTLPYHGEKNKHQRLRNKLMTLEQFKSLTQIHSGRRSIIGIFTLLERLEDANAGLELLTNRAVQVDVIARDTISLWYADII